MRLHRLIAILLMIEDQGVVKAKDLAEHLEVSTRTIFRDVDTLCESGIPLYCETGPNGGIRLVEGYAVGIKQLNGEELISLYLNGIGIKVDRKSDWRLHQQNALLKIEKNAQFGLKNQLVQMRRQFYLDEEAWWGDSKPHYDPEWLIAAIRSNMKLDIEYGNREGLQSWRTIRPYGMVVSEQMLYIVAYCEKAGALRTFRCDRISNCELLEASFMVPEDFQLALYWKEAKKQFIELCRSNEGQSE